MINRPIKVCWQHNTHIDVQMRQFPWLFQWEMGWALTGTVVPDFPFKSNSLFFSSSTSISFFFPHWKQARCQGCEVPLRSRRCLLCSSSSMLSWNQACKLRENIYINLAGFLLNISPSVVSEYVHVLSKQDNVMSNMVLCTQTAVTNTDRTRHIHILLPTVIIKLEVFAPHDSPVRLYNQPHVTGN